MKLTDQKYYLKKKKTNKAIKLFFSGKTKKKQINK